MKHLNIALKTFLSVVSAISSFILFPNYAFAANELAEEDLDSNQIFIFVAIVAFQIFLIVLIEFLISIKRSRRARYPKEETASVENLLSKAINEDVIKYDNNAVVLGEEPEAVHIDNKDAGMKKVYDETPYVTESILGVCVNQSTKIDLAEAGKAVIEQFPHNAPASDHVEIGEAKSVKPWGTLVEDDEERPLFITVEEHRENDSTKLVLDHKFGSVEVEEITGAEAETAKIVPKYISSVKQGKGSVKKINYLNNSSDFIIDDEPVPDSKIVISEQKQNPGVKNSDSIASSFVKECGNTASQVEFVKRLCEQNAEVSDEAIARYTDAVNRANINLKNELGSLNLEEKDSTIHMN